MRKGGIGPITKLWGSFVLGIWASKTGLKLIPKILGKGLFCFTHTKVTPIGVQNKVVGGGHFWGMF